MPKANNFKLTSANLIQVNLNSPVKSPLYSAHRGIVSSNYFPPSKPSPHRMGGPGNFTQRLNQSNGSYEIDSRLTSNKLLKFSENITKLHKKTIIQVPKNPPNF